MPESKEAKFQVRRVGGEVDGIVMTLLAKAYDKNESVRLSIALALQELGSHQPDLLLSSLITFVSKKGSKIEHGHRVALLNLLNSVLENQRDNIAEDLAADIVKFAAREMTASRDAIADWQGPASKALVLLSVPYCTSVLDALLELFKPGVVPHYYVTKTFADVAAENGVEFTLRMREVLGRVIPVLGGVRTAPLKWVFATALGRFAGAMSHFKANADSEQSGDFDFEQFNSDMGSAFDVLLSKWMNSKESKVRFTVAESLGYMAPTISGDDLLSRLEKLIPTYLTMFKKEKSHDHLAISQGLCSLLKAAGSVDDGRSLRPLLTSILQGLHPLVSRPVDFKNPNSLKNQGEVLRCFEVLANALPDETLNFVISMFQVKESPSRVGSLIILRHFVTHMDEFLEDKKPLIMSSVNTLVNEQNGKVKRALMQLIVSMSNQEYLELEGGQTLVHFIAKQSACIESKGDGKNNRKSKTKTRSSSNADSDAGSFKNAADHILLVMAHKVPSCQPVLWPYLLELLNKRSFSKATTVLMRCLAYLGEQKREEEAKDYQINFDINPNLPSPHDIMSRCMVLAACPFRNKVQRVAQGYAAVQFMGAIGPNLHENIGEHWDERVPRLLDYLEAQADDEANFDINKWQNSLLRLFKETIAIVGPGQWLRDLAQAMSKQFDLYPGDHEMQRIVHRYLGALMVLIESRNIVNDTIDLMLEKVDHKSEVAQEGCAQGLGFVGSKHLDVVLPKLTAQLTKNTAKRKGSFFSFGGSKKGPDHHVTATVVLCYGYVAAGADSELILSRLEVHILHNLIPVMQGGCPVFLKLALFKSIELIASAVHEDQLPDNKKTWVMQQRDKLLSLLLSFLNTKQKDKKNKPTAEIRMLGIGAATTLINLKPKLEAKTKDKIFDTVLGYISMGVKKEDGKESKETKDADAGSSKGEIHEEIMSNLEVMFSAVLDMDPTLDALVDFCERLNPYITSKYRQERERGCRALLVLLMRFIALGIQEGVRQVESKYPNLGRQAAVIITRCGDSSAEIRQVAAESIQALFYINQLLGNPDNPKPTQEIKLINKIRGRIEVENVDDRMAVIRDFTGLACVIMDVTTVIETAQALLKNGVTDHDKDAAMCAAEVVKSFVASNGPEFSTCLSDMVQIVVKSVEACSRSSVKQSILSSFNHLTNLHFEPIMEEMLQFQVPLAEPVLECFTALFDPEDAKLGERTINHLFTVLNETPIESKAPTPLVMTATSALSEMLTVESAKPLIAHYYEPILCSILMRIGTAQGIGEGISSTDAIKALKRFFSAMDENLILENLDDEKIWDGRLKKKKFDDAITTIARTMCAIHNHRKDKLLKFLSNFYSQQSYVGQRVVATTMLAEFVNHSKDEGALLQKLVQFLLPRVADKIEKVRKQALRGLGNLVTVWSPEVSASGASILSALSSASEDRDTEVAAEAVASLTRVVQMVDEATMAPQLINICFRMRPALDRKDESIRKSAFQLFGALCKFGLDHKGGNQGASGVISNFIDQVHTNLPTLVCHLHEDDRDISEACHETLKKAALLLTDDFAKCVDEITPHNSHDLDDFITEAVPILTANFPDRLRGYLDSVLQYFTSRWTVVRCNAVTFLGVMLASTSTEDRRRINLSAAVQELTKMLSASEPSVRTRAAKAMSLLYEC